MKIQKGEVNIYLCTLCGGTVFLLYIYLFIIYFVWGRVGSQLWHMGLVALWHAGS